MPETVLVLRTCKPDLRSTNDFLWPESGPVAAPDWDPAPHCGNGLHGWLHGEGDGSLGHWKPEARWLVVEVEAAVIVDLDGKCKFPSGTVVHCGDRESATRYLAEHGCAGRAIIGGTATAGFRGTATAGDGGTATAGDEGTATAGDGGTATAGDGGTATAGDGGVLSVRWWDESRSRYRVAVGYVGEDGLKPNVRYRLTPDGQWTEAESA